MNAHAVLSTSKAFAEASGIPLSTASWRIFGDNKKLTALENGGDLYTGRAAQAMQWLSDNWPESAHWPADVPRPCPSEERAA